LEEKNLIQELRKRNKFAFDYLFTYYYSGLCNFAYKYLGDHQSAEDVVQDIFVSFYFESPQLEIKSSLKSYLFVSVRNRCMNWHKHHQSVEKYRQMILRKSDERDDLPVEMLAESELRSAIEKGMEKLPLRCREIFVMSRMKGLSNQQIADELHLSKRTVELQITNALKILRTELTDYLPVWLLLWLLG
jgi:RNA polymerase sigma-70 factor, ECF subfamily